MPGVAVVERVGREPLAPEFWPFVASSPALLYATISISALDLHNQELQTFRKPSYTFLRYKYESIKEVNRNMQLTHEQLSDSTVCAVAVLALSDVSLSVFVVTLTRLLMGGAVRTGISRSI